MLTRDEILKRIENKPWVSPFERIIGIYDQTSNTVQVYEYHARNSCYGAAAWAVFHYKRTSPLVLSAKRDGARDIFTLNLGKAKLDLKPSYSSAGIEEVKIESGKIFIRYSGLAGGGVGSSLCRALASNVSGVEIHEEGGGEKLGSATIVLPMHIKVQVGVDDTDKAGAGATWSLANEIAFKLAKKNGVEYLNHTLVQLYPATPEKTTNCVATVLTFAVYKGRLKSHNKELIRNFKALTLSMHTGLALFQGIEIPNELVQFSDSARTRVVTLDEAKKIAEQLKIVHYRVPGERGLIGATAALGYAEHHEIAVRPVV